MFGKTYSVKTAEIEKKWVVIDATGLVVGRLASVIAPAPARQAQAEASRPMRTTGTTSVVINADKVVFTGRKREQKVYYHHTGYPGGIKERSAKFILEGRFPERIVEKAVERMLPRGPLGRAQLGNLRVYKGAEHPHTAQQPTTLDVGAMNSKNVKVALTWPKPYPPCRISHPPPRHRHPPRPCMCRSSTSTAAPTRPESARMRSHAVWLKPGKGVITVNSRTIDTYFARPVLRMIVNQPFVVAGRVNPVRHRHHGGGWWPFGAGRRGAPRPFQGAHLLRAGPAARAEARGLPDPRRARGRAQEVRPQEGPSKLPVLQALIGQPAARNVKAPSGELFRLGCV